MKLQGALTQNWDFLREVRNLATRNDIVLVFDECTSGFRQTFSGLHMNMKLDRYRNFRKSSWKRLCNNCRCWREGGNGGCTIYIYKQHLDREDRLCCCPENSGGDGKDTILRQIKDVGDGI